MARLAIKRDVLISLFAKSGNVCAFPGCNHELVTARNIFVGQLCHIEAARPGGQRYNSTSTDEERRSTENLLLLCYRHHKETDDVSAYDAHALRAMKHLHESAHGQKPFKVNEAFIHRLEAEMRSYWLRLAAADATLHVAPEFAVNLCPEIAAVAQFAEIEKSVRILVDVLAALAKSDAVLNDEIRAHLQALGYELADYDKVPYFENPFWSRNWETHSLLVHNTLTDIIVALKQAEVKFLEEYVKTHSNEVDALGRLEIAKGELREMAVSTGYAD